LTVALLSVRLCVRGCSCWHIHCGNSRGCINGTVCVMTVYVREVKLRDCDMG
jgi:hypothetical protein